MTDASKKTLLSGQMRGLLDAIGNVVVIIGKDHRIVEWNLEAEHIYGWSREEALGKDYVETFLPEEARAEVTADIRKVLAGHSTPSFVNPVMSRDGTERVMHWSVGRVLDDEGQPAAIVASGYDVTELKEYRSQLERSQAELQAILDKAPIVVYVKDLEGRFTFVNRGFDELFAFQKGFVIGKKDADFLPPEVAEQNRTNDRSALTAGRPVESEETIPGKDGLHVYLTSKFPLVGADGVAYASCGVAADITSHKVAEEERAMYQAQIIEAQRSALRELSTPLLPIAPGVVLLPLVGAIDAARAALVIETLLEGVVAHQAEVAILDITGVRTVDAEVANGIAQAAKATALLGAEVVLTGVRPAAARTLVELGVDMREIVTLSSLQQGVAHAIGRSRRR